MSSNYTEESLRQMRGQAVKDIWHAMIGKPAGIKNTTGLKNGDEILRAILEGQQDPAFLERYSVRAPKQFMAVEQKEMPPKSGDGEPKKRGPKPKVKSVSIPSPRPTQLLAYESSEIPVRVCEITRISVKKFIVNDTEYFLDKKTYKLYTVVENKPGEPCGLWNTQTREIDH